MSINPKDLCVKSDDNASIPSSEVMSMQHILGGDDNTGGIKVVAPSNDIEEHPQSIKSYNSSSSSSSRKNTNNSVKGASQPSEAFCDPNSLPSGFLKSLTYFPPPGVCLPPPPPGYLPPNARRLQSNDTTNVPLLAPAPIIPTTAPGQLHSILTTGLDGSKNPGFVESLQGHTPPPTNNSTSASVPLSTTSSKPNTNKGTRNTAPVNNNPATSTFNPNNNLSKSAKDLLAEDKRHRRLIRNREAAKKNRSKKKEWIEGLQIRTTCLTEDNKGLMKKSEMLQNELNWLRSLLLRKGYSELSIPNV